MSFYTHAASGSARRAFHIGPCATHHLIGCKRQIKLSQGLCKGNVRLVICGPCRIKYVMWALIVVISLIVLGGSLAGLLFKGTRGKAKRYAWMSALGSSPAVSLLPNSTMKPVG
jgi:hypothetical protein